MNKIKTTLSIIVIIVLFCGLVLGTYKFQRYVNYKAGYQSHVQKDLVPLIKRIDDLENRVKVLENNP